MKASQVLVPLKRIAGTTCLLLQRDASGDRHHERGNEMPTLPCHHSGLHTSIAAVCRGAVGVTCDELGVKSKRSYQCSVIFRNEQKRVAEAHQPQERHLHTEVLPCAGAPALNKECPQQLQKPFLVFPAHSVSSVICLFSLSFALEGLVHQWATSINLVGARAFCSFQYNSNMNPRSLWGRSRFH